MRLKDLVGKMAIRTAEPFSTEPPSGIVTGFGLFGKPTVFRFNQKYMDEPVKIVNVKAMKKATIWAHDKFGLKIKDIWQFYQVASFDEERENLEERRKGSKKRTPGVDMEEIHDHPWESISENPEASAQSLGRFQGERIYSMVESLPDCSIQRLDKA